MRTRDVGWPFRHSSRITNFLECVFTLEHCICTYVGSNPLKVIPLLCMSSPCRGNYIISGTGRERTRRRLIIETALEESRDVALVL